MDTGETLGGEDATEDFDNAVAAVEDGLVSELGPREEPADPPEPTEDKPAAPAVGKAPATPDPAAPAPGVAAPKWWTPAGGDYAALPEPARKAIEAQETAFAAEREMFQNHTTVSEGMGKILGPYAQVFKDYGVNPFDHVANLLQAHATLSFGRPEEKAAIIQNLIRECGLDPSKLATGDARPYDPAVVEMQQRLSNLQRNFGAVVNEVQGQRQKELEAEVTKFAEDPSNIHFGTVVDLMIASMQKNPNQTLKECYDRAVMDHPVAKAKEIDRLASERAEQKAKEARDRANAARRASGANVRSTGRERSNADSTGSWEADLPNMLNDINSRTS